MYNITAIKNYILYLKKECNLAVTLHPVNESLILTTELITFNIHENPYCIYVKTCPQAQLHCIHKQAAVYKKSERGSYIGTCHAGVREYVYPIKADGELKGFISVSGYADSHGEEYISAISRKYALPKKDLALAYRSLKREIPDKQTVDTLLQPLCDMLELAYLKTDNTLQEETLAACILRFIKQNYTRPITSKTLCEHFGYSRSHISHTFTQSTHKSLKEYLTDLRVENAKQLLQSSELNVTEIALSLGFLDCNYFTHVFKKQTGISPSAYRKQVRG